MKYLHLTKQLLFLGFIFLNSCKKNNETLAKKLPFVNGSLGNVNIEVASRNEIAYLKHFEETRATVGYHCDDNIACNGKPVDTEISFLSLSGFTNDSSLYVNNVKYIPVGSLNIGGYNIPMNEKNIYEWKPNESIVSSLFGNEISFSVDGNSSHNFPKTELSMYVPKRLNVTYNNPTNDFLKISRNENFRIDWDADNLNSNGVLMIIRAESLLRNGYPNPDSSLINVPQNIVLAIDDGSYTFQPSDFAGIPPGVSMKIFILRGNISISNVNGCKTKFMAYDAVFVSCLGLID